MLESRIQTAYAKLVTGSEVEGGGFRKFVDRDQVLAYLVRDLRHDMGRLDRPDSPAMSNPKGKLLVTNELLHRHAQHELAKLLGIRASLPDSAHFNYHEFEEGLLAAMGLGGGARKR